MSKQQEAQENSGAVKDPKDWKSGNDPVTPAQQSYLETLAEQTGEEV